MGTLIGCVPIFCGCSKGIIKEDYNSSSFFAMDTVMEIQIDGDEELLAEAEQMVADLEKKLSVTDSASEVGKLNHDKIGRLSPDSAVIFNGAMDICKATEGALDISVYPVLKDWGFTTGEYKVPEETELQELLQQVDYSKIQMKETSEGGLDIILPDNMEIDLGSVVKGYTGTALSDFFKENGVNSALINLGGNVQCIGEKQDGSPWKIAIKSPFPDSKSGIIGVLETKDKAIVTSGGYERYFEEDGEVYWHIIDPSTGWPAKNGLVSVSIIGENGLKCDGLSTALFVKGLDGACEYWKAQSDFEAIMITDKGEVYITEGLKDIFSLSPEYNNAKLNIITR